jgi:uncharacterized protein
MKKKSPNIKAVLSIDGGGIRGVIPGQIVVSIEKKLKQKTSDPEARIGDYFDFLAGTSTGGILTCAYLCPGPNGRPKYSAEEVVGFYLERGDEIFSIPVKHRLRTLGGVRDEKYPADELEDALNDYFGETKLSELLRNCLITSYDIKRRQGHFFTQKDAREISGYDFLVREVARATSAAPTYFECAKVKSLTNVTYPLVDGGVFVNNPSMCAYAEVHQKYKCTAKDMAILSLGTGYTREQYDYNSAKDWGLAQWVKPLIDIMMAGVSDTVHYQLKQMFDAAGVPANYVRLNTEMPIGVSTDMDDASQQNLNALRELGTETAEICSKQIDDYLDMILT